MVNDGLLLRCRLEVHLHLPKLTAWGKSEPEAHLPRLGPGDLRALRGGEFQAPLHPDGQAGSVAEAGSNGNQLGRGVSMFAHIQNKGTASLSNNAKFTNVFLGSRARGCQKKESQTKEKQPHIPPPPQYCSIFLQCRLFKNSYPPECQRYPQEKSGFYQS